MEVTTTTLGLSRKKLNSLAHRVSKGIIKKVLAHAYVLVRTNGLEFRIARLDGVRHQTSSQDTVPNRINVIVDNGMVTKSWVG